MYDAGMATCVTNCPVGFFLISKSRRTTAWSSTTNNPQSRAFVLPQALVRAGTAASKGKAGDSCSS
eukprot:10522652-Lingulodinium_polyedra.AAC.1